MNEVSRCGFYPGPHRHSDATRPFEEMQSDNRSVTPHRQEQSMTSRSPKLRAKAHCPRERKRACAARPTAPPPRPKSEIDGPSLMIYKAPPSPSTARDGGFVHIPHRRFTHRHAAPSISTGCPRDPSNLQHQRHKEIRAAPPSAGPPHPQGRRHGAPPATARTPPPPPTSPPIPRPKPGTRHSVGGSSPTIQAREVGPQPAPSQTDNAHMERTSREIDLTTARPSQPTPPPTHLHKQRTRPWLPLPIEFEPNAPNHWVSIFS